VTRRHHVILAFVSATERPFPRHVIGSKTVFATGFLKVSIAISVSLAVTDISNIDYNQIDAIAIIGKSTDFPDRRDIASGTFLQCVSILRDCMGP
jgi:hypothetical protein